MIGATIIPATAPIRAARPQPSASIQPTRIPTSRLPAGFCAAARSARPRLVKRKKSQRRTSITSVTPITPRSCGPNTTRPIRIGARGNGLGNGNGARGELLAPESLCASVPLCLCASVVQLFFSNQV